MFLGSYKKSETTSDSKLVRRILGSGLRFTLRHHEGTELKNFACVITNRFLAGREHLIAELVHSHRGRAPPTFWGQQNTALVRGRRRLPRRSAGHGRVAGRGGSTRAGLNLASRGT